MTECRACFYAREAEQDLDATCDPCGWKMMEGQQPEGDVAGEEHPNHCLCPLCDLEEE